MKIAVIGCGAVGTFYGAKLARAGHEVHFLLRSDFQAVRQHGVSIRSPQGDFRVSPNCAQHPEQIGPSELVLIGLKTTANAQFQRLVPPVVDAGTVVLTLQNGLGNEEQLARLVGEHQIMGGLCFVCLNRLSPGVVHHIDHGLVVVGQFQRAPGPRTHEVVSAFRRANVPCEVTDNLARAHWEKLTWNIPFNGLGVAGSAGLEAVLAGKPPTGKLGPIKTTDLLLADPQWSKLVRELILEIVAAARGLGFAVSESIADTQIQRTRTMGAYKASTLLDFERGQPLELQSLFLEPLRQAKKVGVPVPRLEALCRLLQELDPGRLSATTN